MANVEEKSLESPDRARAGQGIEKELQDLRADVAALVASLQQYGALGAEELKGRAKGISEDAIAESLNTIRMMQRQVDLLRSQLEGDLRAHPLAWLAGALGIGLLFGLLVSHRR